MAHGASADEAMGVKVGAARLQGSGRAGWSTVKAKRVLAALFRLGWQQKRQSESHRTLCRDGWSDVVFAFHDGEEIGPRMLGAHCSEHRLETGRPVYGID